MYRHYSVESELEDQFHSYHNRDFQIPINSTKLDLERIEFYVLDK